MKINWTNIRTSFHCMLLIVLIASCSVQRFIPKGERIYKGASVHVKKNPETSTSVRSLKSTIKLAATPRANKFLFGQPYKVWWWYVIGEPKREKGFRAFLRNRLGEPPVFSSRVNPKATAENMEALLTNLGYFHSTVQGDTTNYSYFTKAVYNAQVEPQYTIKSVTWVNDSSRLMRVISRIQAQSLLKPGQPYRLSDITAERERIDLTLKNRGFYFFNPDYLMAYADSTIGNRQVDIIMNIKKTTPEDAKIAYRINNITVFPNYTLASPELDTAKYGVEIYDGIRIRDSVKKFRSSLFARTITYRPGSLYNSRTQNSTLNRFISLGAFKFVKNRFAVTQVNDTANRLNVYYYLTPAKKRSLQAEVDAFSKENNYLGSQVSINWKNRNQFGGAEQLSARAYGGFETSYADSLSRNNNYRLGAELQYKVPKYLVPFFTIRETNFYQPNTSISTGYEWYRKNLFYTKNLFKLQYESTWKTTFRKQYTLAPVSLSYLNATQVTDSFYKQVALMPSLMLNVYSEAILGSYFSYTLTSPLRTLKNKWYFNTSIDVSGNIAGLITGAKNFREKTIFGTPFAQYVKADFDLHYTRRLPNKWDWANRIQVGVGYPYNNSKLLPFAKQYTIGGSSSLRGFRTRNVGPGTYRPTAADQLFYQIIGGDFKLLGNTEIRVPFSPKISGAVFTDVGNIWTKDTILFGKAGQLSKDFLNELAVASGVGIRFDATVILLRVDVGIPLRKPYLPSGQRWVFNQINFGSGSWRRENLMLNIALGLPF